MCGSRRYIANLCTFPLNFSVNLKTLVFKKFFINLFIRERELTSWGGEQMERERKSQAGSMLSMESDTGLNIMTLGS